MMEHQICLGVSKELLARSKKSNRMHITFIVAHSLNLCLQDCGKNVPVSETLLDFQMSLSLLLKHLQSD